MNGLCLASSQKQTNDQGGGGFQDGKTLKFGNYIVIFTGLLTLYFWILMFKAKQMKKVEMSRLK